MEKRGKFLLIPLFLMMFISIIHVNATTCKITKGTGENLGDEVSCGTENFYVVNIEEEKVTLFSMYNLKVERNWLDSSGNSIAVVGSDLGIQSSECTALKGTIHNIEYQSTCSGYTSDENKEKYFRNYSDYLKNTIQLEGKISVLQPSMEWLAQIGCTHKVYQTVESGPTEEVNCKNSGYPFLYSTSYFLSKKISVYEHGVEKLKEYPTLESNTGASTLRMNSFGAGYRPVVIILKSNLFETNKSIDTLSGENSKKDNQTTDIKNSFKASYIGYCIGTIILILGIMVIYQERRKDKIEIKIKK